MAKRRAPEVVTLSPTQLEELLAKLAGLLPAEIYQLVEKVLADSPLGHGSHRGQGDQPEPADSGLIFGAKTEKTKQLFPPPPASSPTTAAAAASRPKRKGHGRTAAAGYTGAKRVRVTHPQLRSGRCLSRLQTRQTLRAKTARTIGAHHRPTVVCRDPLRTGEATLQPLRPNSLLPQHLRKRG